MILSLTEILETFTLLDLSENLFSPPHPLKSQRTSVNLLDDYHTETFAKLKLLARNLKSAKTMLNHYIGCPLIFSRSDDYRLKSEMQIWYVPLSSVTRNVYAMSGCIPNHRIGGDHRVAES